MFRASLAAALTRQNPRDLFDVGVLLYEGRFDEALWRTFLVYLTASPKPAWEILEPAEPKDFEKSFRTLFDGMTAKPTSAEALLEARRQLLARIPALLDDASRAFLESVERELPDFGLIGLAHAADLPGVKRKLQNLAQRSDAKREADQRQLSETLERIGR